MTTTSATAKTYGIRAIAGQHGNTLHRLVDAFSTWRRHRRQSAELHALGDDVLKDIGVSRWEIDSIVNSPSRDASGRARCDALRARYATTSE